MDDQKRPDVLKSLPPHEADPPSGESTFVRLLDGIRDCAIYMIDGNGRVSSWNAGAERIKGYSAAEVIGKRAIPIFMDPTELAARANSLSEELGETIPAGPGIFTRARCMRP